MIGQEQLATAVAEANSLIQPPDDIFYQELEDKERTVKNFLPALLRVIHFEGNEAGKPIIESLEWLKSKSKKEAPLTVINQTWKRYVFNKENQFNKSAYIFCVLDGAWGVMERPTDLRLESKP